MANFPVYLSVYKQGDRFFTGLDRTEDGGKAGNRISVKRIDIEVPDDLKPLENWLWQAMSGFHLGNWLTQARRCVSEASPALSSE
jgi:hypothetical protein